MVSRSTVVAAILCALLSTYAYAEARLSGKDLLDIFEENNSPLETTDDDSVNDFMDGSEASDQQPEVSDLEAELTELDDNRRQLDHHVVSAALEQDASSEITPAALERILDKAMAANNAAAAKFAKHYAKRTANAERLIKAGLEVQSNKTAADRALDSALLKASMDLDRTTNEVVAKYTAQQAAASRAYKATLKTLVPTLKGAKGVGVHRAALLKAEKAFTVAQEAAAAEQKAGMRGAEEKYRAAENAANLQFRALSADEEVKEEAKAAEDEKEYELEPLVGDPEVVGRQVDEELDIQRSPFAPSSEEMAARMARWREDVVELEIGDETMSMSRAGTRMKPANTPIPADAKVQLVPDISRAELEQVMAWIKARATAEKLPFCWKKSYGRGVGTIPGRLADCDDGYSNHGATCFRNAHTILAPSQLATCPSGYTNTGLTCYMPPWSYTKCCTTIWGACACDWHKTKAGKAYNTNGRTYTNMGCNCQSWAHSAGVPNTCPKGYFQSIVKRCHKNCPEGYTNTGETCYRGPHLAGGLGSMHCKNGMKEGHIKQGEKEYKWGGRCYPLGQDGKNKSQECYQNGEKDAGLCYARCEEAYFGVGPVCWQTCPNKMVGCGAGCAKDSMTCASSIADMVIAPLILAANIATFGLTKAGATATVSASKASITIGSKTWTATGKVGKAAIKVAKAGLNIADDVGTSLAKGIAKSSLAKGIAKSSGTSLAKGIAKSMKKVTVWEKIVSKGGKVIGVANKVRKVGTELYDAAEEYGDAYSGDFTRQTSAEINQEVDEAFGKGSVAANFVKKAWGDIQLAEMSSANGWAIADTALSIAAILDPSGVMGVVAAYAKPKCADHAPLPCLAEVMHNCSESQKKATKKLALKAAPQKCINDDKCLKAHSSWSTYDCAYSTSSGANKNWCTKFPKEVGKCCPKFCNLCKK